jgi:ribosomal protein S18 acetylase RimI-like enzyme
VRRIHPVTIQIHIHQGPRASLQALFAEADDSDEQIASYRDLGEILVAVDEGKIIGHAQVVGTDEEGTFEIKSLAVREERRSQGVGAKLVAAACEHCRLRGGRLVFVATAAASIPALQFYQRQGFRVQRVIRDFYSPERGYRPLKLNGIRLRDEIILDLDLTRPANA